MALMAKRRKHLLVLKRVAGCLIKTLYSSESNLSFYYTKISPLVFCFLPYGYCLLRCPLDLPSTVSLEFKSTFCISQDLLRSLD